MSGYTKIDQYLEEKLSKSIEELKMIPLTVKLVDTKLVAVNELIPVVILLDAFKTSAFDGNAVPPVTPAV